MNITTRVLEGGGGKKGVLDGFFFTIHYQLYLIFSPPSQPADQLFFSLPHQLTSRTARVRAVRTGTTAGLDSRGHLNVFLCSFRTP